MSPSRPGHYEEALECFGKSLAFNRDYEKARSWQQKLLAELAEAQRQQEQQREQQQEWEGEGEAGAAGQNKGGKEGAFVEPPEEGVDRLSLSSSGGGGDGPYLHRQHQQRGPAGVATLALQEEGEEAATTMLS